jgi:hypothetical protein
MKEFRPVLTRQHLKEHMGDLTQLAGHKRYEMLDGKARGVEAVDVRTGTGFSYTVLPGRGMDIAWADYKGVPISYISKTGIAGPAYYESEGMAWLRNFFGGLVTTCGLTNVGSPAESVHPVIGPVKHGLHGRISNMAAGDVCVSGLWRGDDYKMTVSGYMREAQMHAENLVIRRTVTSMLGQRGLSIHDEVINEGCLPQPFMLLYHINAGYPLLDAGSRLIARTQTVTAASEKAKSNIESFDRMGPPKPGAAEDLYFLDIIPDPDAICRVGFINDDLELGIYIRYHKSQLPFFTEWKQLGEAEYVVGLEPGNCLPVGRSEMERRGKLQCLPPGERQCIELEIGILDGMDEINGFIDET